MYNWLNQVQLLIPNVNSEEQSLPFKLLMSN